MKRKMNKNKNKTEKKNEDDLAILCAHKSTSLLQKQQTAQKIVYTLENMRGNMSLHGMGPCH